MDMVLTRKLLDQTPLEDLKKYLEVYDSDADKIQGMTGTQMLQYMASRPKPPLAMSMLRHSASGNITFAPAN